MKNNELTTVESKSTYQNSFTIPTPPKNVKLVKPVEMSFAEYKRKFLK